MLTALNNSGVENAATDSNSKEWFESISGHQEL